MTTTAMALGDMEAGATGARRPSLIKVIAASVGVFFFPKTIGKMLLRVSMWHAMIVAAINAILAVGWLYAFLVTVDAWVRHKLNADFTLGMYFGQLKIVPPVLSDTFARMGLLPQICLVLAMVFIAMCFFMMIFFMLLPFGARPGSNWACVKHVSRLVLVATGFVHIWSPAMIVLFLFFIRRGYVLDYTGFATILNPLFLTLSALSLWSLPMLVRAVKLDYRMPEDMPRIHDPWCDECGYNLVAAEHLGRCPECGKAVTESTSEDFRRPTAWEQHPVPWNIRVILRQAIDLIRHPRRLFFSMPTLTGQRAAQRWLVGSVLLVGITAFWIVPVLPLVLDVEWSTRLFTGGLVTGIVWAFLALMMVGIETAGIATFSRLKNHPGGGVYLAAAAKVTGYSSMLMLFWVFCGGLQILGSLYWEHGEYARMMHLTIRTQQIIHTSALCIAHIGGLLWYELTVYRGIRAIQFANR